MAKQTVLQEVRQHMRELLDKKDRELQELQEMTDKARAEVEEAAQKATEATDKMDLPAYSAARERQIKANIALEMYSKKLEQLNINYTSNGLVTERESNKTLKDLEAYEKELGKQFAKDISGHVKALAELYHRYADEINATEQTITAWQESIHKYYTTTTDIKGTPHNTRVTPFHYRGYDFCGEAYNVRDFLDKIGDPTKEG